MAGNLKQVDNDKCHLNMQNYCKNTGPLPIWHLNIHIKHKEFNISKSF